MGCGISRGADPGFFVNRLLFPAPESSSYASWSFKGELIWVPLAQYRGLGEGLLQSEKDSYSFPCRLMRYDSAEYLLIFFHKNADDLGTCKPAVERLRSCLGVHVLVVEYPGYGLCSTSSAATADQVNKHAFAAVEFSQRVLGLPLRRILVMGSCVGTGPAIAVAAEVEVGGLVLLSPFLSVVQLFKDHARVLSRFVANQFPNDTLISQVRSPTLIYHERQDKLVAFAHAEQLYNSMKCKAKLIDARDGDHHTGVMEDERQFLLPMKEFFGLPGSSDTSSLQVPDFIFQRRRRPDELLLAQQAGFPATRVQATGESDGKIIQCKVQPPSGGKLPSGEKACSEYLPPCQAPNKEAEFLCTCPAPLKALLRQSIQRRGLLTAGSG